MLSRAVIFVFCLLGLFALLMGNIPTAFLVNQGAWNPSYRHADEEVARYFSIHNITMYDSTLQDFLVYPEVKRYGLGLPSGNNIAFGFENAQYGGYGTFVKVLDISHETQHSIGPLQWWTHERLTFRNKNGVDRNVFIEKNELLTDFDSALNGTLYYAHSSQMQLNVVYSTNASAQTLEQAWDAGIIRFFVSYQLNASLTAVNMWAIIGQLLTFQSPSLGVPGFFGSLLNAIIAIPLWSAIAYILYKLIAGIVPFMSGGSGD